MPTNQSKARRLIKQGKAKVIKTYPFTIQLGYATGEAKQEVVLGIDVGYGYIGFSAVTKKQELISGEVVLENGMSKRLIERAMYRRCRRNKLWYRESRFLNRGQEGWIPPSVKRRIETHINLVKRMTKLLPISQVNVEVANFDIQKIQNPEIEGKNYQRGNLYEYENMKAYLISREQGKCQLCGKKYGKQGWHLHHVIHRSKGGTDRSDNLALLHESCHDKLHKKGLKLKTNKQFKAETFMSISRWKILEGIQRICSRTSIVYGYETKVKRIENVFEKTHNNDAFIIAEGTNQNRSFISTLTQKKHNNIGMVRIIDKQFRIANKKDAFGENPWTDITGYGLCMSTIE